MRKFSLKTGSIDNNLNSGPKLTTSKSFHLLDVPKEAPCLRKSFSCTSLPVPKNFTFVSVDLGVSEERWYMLGLYVALSALSSAHWIQYSVIANIITSYYQVSELSVDWTAMIFALAYVVLVLPVTRFIDAKGLRISAVIGGVGTALGACIKVAASNHDAFVIAIIGQAVLAVSQVFIHSMPAKLGAVWFPPEEESTACCVGLFGHQLGIAIGFLATPFLVQNHQNSDQVTKELTYMSTGLALVTTLVVIITIIKFRSAPLKPPSHAQAVQRSIDQAAKSSGETNAASSYRAQISCIWRLIRTNKGFVYLLLAFGLNAGVCSAISTLLNQMLLNYYPDSTIDAGILGSIMVLTGAIVGPLYGRALDSTRCYSTASISVSALSSVAMFALVAALVSGSMRLVYVAGGFLGIFLCGFPAVASELASEVTFPEPEGVVTGVINTVTQVFGILVTLCMVRIQTSFGDLVANLSCGILLVLATVVTILVPPNFKRQETRAGLAYAAAIECEEAREHLKFYKNKENAKIDEEDEGIYV